MNQAVPLLLNLLVLAILATPAPAGSELRLHLRDASLRLARFPHSLDELTGSVRLEGDRIRIEDLQFRVLHSSFRLSGFSSRVERRHELDLQAVEIPPGDLRLLLPASEGFVPLTPPRVRVRFRRQGADETREYAIAVDRFRFSRPALGPSMQDLPGEDLQIRAEDAPAYLRISEFRFRLFAGNFRYSQDLDRHKGLERFQARLDELRLDLLAERLPRWRGKLGGRLTLSARREGEWTGGSFRLDHGWLKDLKALQRLADNLGVESLEQIRFQRLSARYEKRGPLLQLQEIELKSELLDASFSLQVHDDTEALEGRGWVRVHLKALAGSRKLKNFGFLRRIMRKNTLRLKLRVGGSLDDPEIRLSL